MDAVITELVGTGSAAPGGGFDAAADKGAGASQVMGSASYRRSSRPLKRRWREGLLLPSRLGKDHEVAVGLLHQIIAHDVERSLQFG